MPEGKRRTKENIEDVERISNILNRRTRDKKNPFLKPDGSLNLIEKFPDYGNKKPEKLTWKQKDLIGKKSGRLRW